MSPVNEARVTRIPEKISENQQSRGRGRPRVMEAMRAVLERNDVGTDYRSERQRVNRAYALDAIRRLGGGEDPAFFWLVNYVEQDRRPHNIFVKREQWGEPNKGTQSFTGLLYYLSY